MWNPIHIGLRTSVEGVQASFIGRVCDQRRGRYRLLTERGELDAVIRGRLAYVAEGAEDLPAVGDFVRFHGADDLVVIEEVLPRRSVLRRRDPSKPQQAQVLCANVDTVFIVCPATQPLNLARVERFAVMARDGESSPILVISKSDAVASPGNLAKDAMRRLRGVPVLTCSALSREGIGDIDAFLGPGETGVLVGVSGAGKTTLLNALCQEERTTQATRDGDDKGRHTTTSRSLLFTAAGGMLIDTPGVREFGLTEASSTALHETFVDVESLASGCRFRDCTHDGEPGCAIAAAMAEGALDPDSLASYRKLQREEAFFRRKQSKEEQSNAKRRWKSIHKSMRSHHKRTSND